MNMKNYIIIIIAAVALTAVSCSRELDVTPPNAITNEQVYDLLTNSDDATRETILGGIAASLPLLVSQPLAGMGSLDYRHYHYTGMAVMRGFEGNDMVFGNNTATSAIFGTDEYRWVSIRTSTGTTQMYWKHGYDMIAAANKVLAFLPDEIVGNNAALKRFRGQALFIRAFAYNHLLENFQDAYVKGGSKPGVPVYTVFDPSQPYQARASLDECYQQVNADLNKAIQDFGDSFFTEAKNDIDVGVAFFLRARVALCMGNWQQVISDCQKIINQYPDSFMTEDQYVAKKEEVDGKDQYFAINSGFLDLTKNPETIWGFFYSDGTAAAQSYWLNSYGTTQQGSTRGYNVQIDQRLYNQIADDDYRKNNFLGSEGGGRYDYADGGSQNIMPYANLKFASTVGKTGGTNPVQAAATNNQNDWTMMRLSEAYLMLAEAQSKSGNDGGAKATLDKLIDARTNGAYDSDTYPSHAGLSMIQKIQLQTRIEMWGEKGLEFYNNRRWDIAVNRSGATNHWHNLTIPVSEMTMQIPVQSISLNGLLEQNP